MFLLLVKNHIRTVGIESIDNILLFYPIYIIVTIFAIAGFSQSINIIDGINGLSSEKLDWLSVIENKPRKYVLPYYINSLLQLFLKSRSLRS